MIGAASQKLAFDRGYRAQFAPLAGR
ncbi:hypothetical protein DSM3645_17595 [Blastopirellula marina DSM 3645]|uniref:Uncharacterized protein n=1 Tax=Blastopirellula marina DSM 3645 TaxID=314230 RepID=A3ZNU1_9BACT|nr:hypothetical protein DSM3645_17595 [Blastopirellula marina DSM 3645]